MRRRSQGTYEPYNTNNGENHCYSREVRRPPGALDTAAPKVKWFRELVSVRPFRNVLHDPGRQHQPLSFQWVTRVGSRGEEKKCKEISALCPLRVESATAVQA